MSIALVATEIASNPVAERVHAALRAHFDSFEQCHYPNDFLVHDLEELRRSAMPGATLWWTMSSCGSHLLWPGADVEIARCAIAHRGTLAFRVDVGTTHDSVRQLSAQGFVDDVANFATCLKDLRTCIERPDRQRREIRITSASGWIVSAAITLTPQTPDRGAPSARIEVTTNPDRSIKGFELMLMLNTVDGLVSRELGTLFWQRDGETLIDGAARSQWISRRVAAPGVEPSSRRSQREVVAPAH